MASSAPALRSFNLALIQLGRVGSDKTKNIAHAREQILKAASREDGSKPQLIVLPVSVKILVAFRRTFKFADGRRQECFNSPYGATHFPAYAETIGYKPGEPYDPAKSKSDTIRMLSSVARETGTWLVGGGHSNVSRHSCRKT
jgi:omega-amidase